MGIDLLHVASFGGAQHHPPFPQQAILRSTHGALRFGFWQDWVSWVFWKLKFRLAASQDQSVSVTFTWQISQVSNSVAYCLIWL